MAAAALVIIKQQWRFNSTSRRVLAPGGVRAHQRRQHAQMGRLPPATTDDKTKARYHVFEECYPVYRNRSSEECAIGSCAAAKRSEVQARRIFLQCMPCCSLYVACRHHDAHGRRVHLLPL